MRKILEITGELLVAILPLMLKDLQLNIRCRNNIQAGYRQASGKLLEIELGGLREITGQMIFRAQGWKGQKKTGERRKQRSGVNPGIIMFRPRFFSSAHFRNHPGVGSFGVRC